MAESRCGGRFHVQNRAKKHKHIALQGGGKKTEEIKKDCIQEESVKYTSGKYGYWNINKLVSTYSV